VYLLIFSKVSGLLLFLAYYFKRAAESPPPGGALFWKRPEVRVSYWCFGSQCFVIHQMLILRKVVNQIIKER
jgi:hypothetical protein